jgi:hypothetical protein
MKNPPSGFYRDARAIGQSSVTGEIKKVDGNARTITVERNGKQVKYELWGKTEFSGEKQPGKLSKLLDRRVTIKLTKHKTVAAIEIHRAQGIPRQIVRRRVKPQGRSRRK